MPLKSIPLSIKVFFLIAIFGLVVLYFLPVDELGRKCGSESLIPFGIGLLMVLLPLTTVIVERLKKKISNVSLLIFLLLLILLASVIWIILNQGCGRCAYSWQRIRAEMHQLQIAQEIFYKDNNRYADTQEELIDASIFTEKFKNAITNEEFTDSDGEGIESGDNNPKTWSAITYISYKKFNKWCWLTSEGYWYICNQDGCYEEVEMPREAIKDETAGWQTYRDEEYGFEFKYPEEFFHWKPEVKISDCDNVKFPAECPDIETASAPFPPTEEKITIKNIPFCLKKTGEGAAGSTYVSYYYTTIKDKKCLTMYLVLRYTNCGVFGSPDEEAYQKCEYENKVTKPEILNQILSNFRFSE